MGKIIAIANQKGGVGKTTTCVNLCSALNRAGMRTLLCDADPQGNATSAMGAAKNSDDLNLYDVIMGDVTADRAVLRTKYGDIIPGNRDMAGAGIELVSVDDREFVLKNALEPLRNEYDYIIIDCPPSLELLTLNALCAADTVLIPVQCEYFALEGLSDLMNTLRLIKKRLNPDLEVEGVLLTMYDGRTNLSLQVAAEVKRFFKDRVYKTMIPRNVRLSEAPSHGKPVIYYDFSSRGSQAYISLAQEVVQKNRKKGV